MCQSTVEVNERAEVRKCTGRYSGATARGWVVSLRPALECDPHSSPGGVAVGKLLSQVEWGSEDGLEAAAAGGRRPDLPQAVCAP